MKKPMIRFLSLLLICTLALSCAIAEETEETEEDIYLYEIDGNVVEVSGYKLPEPLVPEGTPGTLVLFENLPMSFTLPGGWIQTDNTLQEGLMASITYEPEKYDSKDREMIYIYAGETSTFVDQSKLDQIAASQEELTVEDLVNTVFAEVTDMIDVKEYGSCKFIVYTIPEEQQYSEEIIVRIFITSALTIHKGIIYRYSILGKPENNDFYPDFEQILTSVTFAE